MTNDIVEAEAVERDESLALAVRAEQSLDELDPKIVEHQLDQIMELQRSVLKEGVDYGKVPGGNKPGLFKPGAEAILAMYGYAPASILILERTENWSGEPFFRYIIEVTLVHKRTGSPAGVGVGECNSLERKYQKKVCTIYDRSHRHGIGCYERFTADEFDYSGVNTFLKMATKRALVDATLNSTMAARIFTQDLEDKDPGHPAAPKRRAREAPSTDPGPPPETPARPGPGNGSASEGPRTDAQEKAIYGAGLKRHGLTRPQLAAVVKERTASTDTKELTYAEASELIDYLNKTPTDEVVALASELTP